MGVQVPFKPLLQLKSIVLPKKQEVVEGPFADEIKQIKEILKDHDTQNNLLPLKFHRHVKPPVHPPKRLLTEKEVVAGKMVPFSKTMVKRERIAMKTKKNIASMSLKTIYETDDYEASRKVSQAPPGFMIR